jgi:riboflavin synthase
MFTGIVETTGKVVAIEQSGTNRSFWIKSPISGELKTDQSVAHDGVCLTVEKVENGTHRVTAIKETLDKSHLGSWATGSIINLERCLAMNGRLDGHLVQGHVDATGTSLQMENQLGSWLFTFVFPEKFAGLMIEKGSICVNGISLTAFNVANDRFSVAIIPYTYEHTNIKNLVPGSLVNLEFDMVGKYIVRNLQLRRSQA